MTIAETLARALQQHQASNLAQAEQLYHEILRSEPGHADAWHLLGVLASQVGRHDLGVEYIRHALDLRPGTAVYHNNLAFAYQALGRLEEAENHCRLAVRLQPEFTAAHNHLGM